MRIALHNMTTLQQSQMNPSVIPEKVRIRSFQAVKKAWVSFFKGTTICGDL